jgi:hypothetical protein
VTQADALSAADLLEGCSTSTGKILKHKPWEAIRSAVPAGTGVAVFRVMSGSA